MNSSLIETLSGLFTTRNFIPSNTIVKGQQPLILQSTEELCKISFNIKKTDSESNSNAYFLILCNELEPVVGRNAQVADVSSEDIKKNILEHMGFTPVFVMLNLLVANLALKR